MSKSEYWEQRQLKEAEARLAEAETAKALVDSPDFIAEKHRHLEHQAMMDWRETRGRYFAIAFTICFSVGWLGYVALRIFS